MAHATTTARALRQGDAHSSVCGSYVVFAGFCLVCVAMGTWEAGRTFTAAYAGPTFTGAHTLTVANKFFEVNLAAY